MTTSYFLWYQIHREIPKRNNCVWVTYSLNILWYQVERKYKNPYNNVVMVSTTSYKLSRNFIQRSRKSSSSMHVHTSITPYPTIISYSLFVGKEWTQLSKISLNTLINPGFSLNLSLCNETFIETPKEYFDTSEYLIIKDTLWLSLDFIWRFSPKYYCQFIKDWVLQIDVF